MKIAMVSEDSSPLAVFGSGDIGGQTVHVAELSAALAQHGHDVTVYTRRDDKGTPDRVVTPQGYVIVRVPAGPPTPLPDHELRKHISDFARYLDARWAECRPDVAHAHSWRSGVAAQLAARPHQVPTVQTFHALGVLECGQQGDRDCAARLKLEKIVARHAGWVAATSTDELFELMRLGRPKVRTSVVPGGVDLDSFNTTGRVARRGAAPRIVAVGKLLPRKGFDTMIEALAAIPDAEYVIVGGPDSASLSGHPEVQRLRTLASELGVADRVEFTGSVAHADMPAVLRSADVVTCTSWYESFGRIPLEAMACGVAVVGSAVGGLLDTVVHDVTGRLVPPGKPRELAETVSMVLRDSFLRRSFGLAGCDRARARYSWDRIAADTLRIYERLATAQACHGLKPTEVGQPTIRSG